MISKPSLLSTEQETSFWQDATNHAKNNVHVWRGECCQSTPNPDAIQIMMSILARLGFPEKDAFAVHLALEEAIVNAHKHGNHNDAGKRVRITYRITAQQMRATIEDQGQGFNPGEIPDPTAPENLEKPSGRGLMLMRRFMTSVRFNRRGNRVTLCKQRTNESNTH